MKRVRRDNLAGDIQLERQIVTGMILSQYFLREATKTYKGDSLSLPFAKIVAGWCTQYYGEFKDAPRQHIQDIYRRNKDELPEDSAAVIEEFLFSLSEEFKKQEAAFNSDYVLKNTDEYFRLRALTSARDKLDRAIISSKIEEGEAVISGFHRATRPIAVGVDPFRDFQYVEDAFNADERELLFSFPGDLGRLLGPFYRSWFGMVVGAQGRGKTWWLLEAAMRALLKRLNVLFVSMEMTEKQMIRRMYHWITGLPNKRWAGEILFPKFDCLWNQDGSCDMQGRAWSGRLLGKGKELPSFEEAEQVGYKICVACRGEDAYTPSVWYKKKVFKELDIQEGIEKAEDLAKYLLRGARLKLVTVPAGLISVKDIRVMLENYEHYQNWMPDIVITDYSDKMAPDNKFEKEYRHRLNDISAAHKALALDKNILVLTASQTSIGRDEDRDIDSGGFAEDIRKKGEIDIGWSLNQTAMEKRRGIMRVKTMKQRHDDYSTLDSCIVLQQLKLGKPYLDSCINRGF